MERLTYAAIIKAGMKNQVRIRLGQCWNRITEILDEAGITNFSIWNADDLLFIYGEVEERNKIPEKCLQKAFNISGEFEELVWLCGPGQKMKLMYHDYGIIRENKELIRHRVFITKLKPGCFEEYKKRHDELIKKRGTDINPGPESNYTIWSDGKYIFGYEEIDTTMETEMTEEERIYSIEWEKSMLNIMEWITDDIDWITGDKKSKSICIAKHN